MKKVFAYAAVALLTIAAVSCNKSLLPDGPKGNKGFVEVGLSLGGEMVDVSYSPLTKGGNPLNPSDSTLYVVAVYCVDSTSSTTGHHVMQDSYLYAHGLFDDMSKAHLKLLAGKRYSIRVKAIVNGISEIYNFSNLYDGVNQARLYSHQGHLTNDFFYKGVDNVVDVTDYHYYGDMGHAEVYYPSGVVYRPVLDIYYGGCDDIMVSQCPDIIPMDMYYSHYRLKFIVNGLKSTDNPLKLKSSYSYDDSNLGIGTQYLTYDSPEYTDERCFYRLEDMYRTVTGDEEYKEYFALSASYTVTIDGQTYTTELLHQTSYYIPRKKTTTFTFNVDHDKIVANGKDFSVKFDSTDLGETGGDYSYSGTIKE